MTTETKQLRAWWLIVGGDSHFHHVNSPQEGARWINEEAAEQLANPAIQSNAFGLEMLEDGHWTDWEGEINGTYYANVDELCDDEDALQEPVQ